jgi:thioester reductase-like protein
MDTILFTGFPGFLGRRVLPEVLGRHPGTRAVCLVQPRYVPQARAAVTALVRSDPELGSRIGLVEGDITDRKLGMGRDAPSVRDVGLIFHLAAVYDLGVAASLAREVNVAGTRNVLDFAERCPALRRFHFVSTCYVSGRYPGTFREDQLEEGQAFNNAYEASKHQAEVEVRRRAEAGLGVTIYRPSVVVGDSCDGRTDKFDGPYFFIRWVLKQGPLAVVPVVGDPREHHLNVVPRDFVARAIAHLSARTAETEAGAPAALTYQLADPRPPTIQQLVAAIGAAAGKEILRVPLPRGLASMALARIPGLARWTGIPAASVDYFVHPTDYDTGRATAHLAGSGIEPPPLLEYLDVLVDFARRHPELGSSPMT